LRAPANGIHIEYETLGDRAARPLLLIGGLASQLINWDDGLCEHLANRGHYVIRFDNRDAGLSTKCDNARSYTLDDMADDAAGLLEVLGIGKAHICGTSMGGIIGQTVAIRHPSRVQSLISIYSTTGNKDLPPPRPEVIGLLLAPPPSERDTRSKRHLLVPAFRHQGNPSRPSLSTVASTLCETL
jgi:pimeloyl-ACP methyl ester carboxylesterase